MIIEHELITERGVAIRERQDLVFREAAGDDDKRMTGRPLRPEWARGEGQPTPWKVEASTVLLFRYSALTFNGHRIHYDLDYATRTEGYPGLVVHGPLQATLMLNLAAASGNLVPRRFLYRGLAPLIAGQAFEVHCRNSDGKVECWTQDAENRAYMEAVAT